jgi:catechol 1,2-dioxygenase
MRLQSWTRARILGREQLVSLVKHLHDFVRDVRLTESEFREAIGLLNEMGELSGDTHNETMLMSRASSVSPFTIVAR